MGSEARQDLSGPRAPHEAEQQCLVRDANEAIERLNVALTTARARLACAASAAIRPA